MNVRILGFSEQHLIEGSRFYEEQAAGLGTYFSMLCLPTSTHTTSDMMALDQVCGHQW